MGWGIYLFMGYDNHIGYAIFLENRNSWRNLSCLVPLSAKASVSSIGPSAGGKDVNEITDAVETESTAPGASFFAKVAIVIGITATVIVISLLMKQPPSGPSLSLPQIVDAQSDAALAATVGYKFSLFGKRVIIPEYTPGYVSSPLYLFYHCISFKVTGVVLFLVGNSILFEISLSAGARWRIHFSMNKCKNVVNLVDMKPKMLHIFAHLYNPFDS